MIGLEENIGKHHLRISNYAKEEQLDSVTRALARIEEIMKPRIANEASRTRAQTELLHAMGVCTMLTDLHLQLPRHEKDALLSAVLLHIYPENFAVADLRDKLVNEFGFDPMVYEIVDTIVPSRDMMDDEQQLFYQRVQENRLALLAIMADRSNIVQQLHRFSTWNAHRYIDETKACYYPMCIYGKEHYFDLLAPISVLMEKTRSLIEVAEILLQRYEVREAELIQDIQALREENATVKGIIAKFRS